MNPTRNTFPNRPELAAALATRVTACAADAVAARGRFRLAIPGGSAVSLLAQGLAKTPTDASNWDLFWADERCVPLDDPDSNYHLARQELLPRLSIPSGNIHAADGAPGPEAAARAYETELARVFGSDSGQGPRFDLILLGVGEDGHIASLFPGNPALDETQRRVVPVRNAPKPPPERISLALPVINQARRILVVATGMGKAEALATIFASDIPLPLLPAQRLRPANGELNWLMDQAAAANLPEPLHPSQPHAEEPS